MFDTHCHLNFQAFDGRVKEVIGEAKKSGVEQIVIPGTDVETSEKAVVIAEKYPDVYAAVGIHPHHVFEIWTMGNKKSTMDVRSSKLDLEARNLKLENNQMPNFQHQNLISSFQNLSSLITHSKVVAIGEVGIDRHYYQKTKHRDYKVDEEFVNLQKKFFLEQIKLAHQYKKSLIIHNREAKKDVLEILASYYSLIPSHSAVFHCCEPDQQLLEFAKAHKMFIGVDGDITYYKEKQEWIKTVPLEMLVLETDSPFLLPEPIRAENFLRLRQGFGGQSNEPKNIPLIAEFVAKLKNISVDEVEKRTTENAKTLFKI